MEQFIYIRIFDGFISFLNFLGLKNTRDSAFFKWMGTVGFY